MRGKETLYITYGTRTNDQPETNENYLIITYNLRVKVCSFDASRCSSRDKAHTHADTLLVFQVDIEPLRCKNKNILYFYNWPCRNYQLRTLKGSKSGATALASGQCLEDYILDQSLLGTISHPSSAALINRDPHFRIALLLHSEALTGGQLPDSNLLLVPWYTSSLYDTTFVITSFCLLCNIVQYPKSIQIVVVLFIIEQIIPKKHQVQEEKSHEMTSTEKNPQHCHNQHYVDTAII